LEPRENAPNSSSSYNRQPGMWFSNRSPPFQQQQQQLQQQPQTLPNNIQVQNQQNHISYGSNNNNINSSSSSNNVISSSDISGLNVDFSFTDKLSSPSSSSSTNGQENPEFSYVDEFLKNAFPTAFGSSDIDFVQSVDMLNVEQQQPFVENVESFNRMSTTSSTQTNVGGTYHRLPNNSTAKSSALSMGTF
jgi:hypothetical protein